MRPSILQPTSVEALGEIIKESRQVLAVGSRTKPRLSQVAEDVTLVSTRGLSGIVEYDPSEFTFTAQAGTPLREIIATLAARGQYLPFDPPLAESGATLGGTVAAGLSGPGRFRYGGLRDFILAVRFFDGGGTLMRGGAKVVKNAAGFDIPKFFAGSLGRFGVLTEVTFKVFPCPPAMGTFAIPCDDAAAAVAHISKAASGRWEFDALDYSPAEKTLFARIRGPQEALEAIATDVTKHWPSARETDGKVWREIDAWSFAKDAHFLARIPMTLAQLPALESSGVRFHLTGGGSAAYVFSQEALPELASLGLRGLCLLGASSPVFLGQSTDQQIAKSLKAVFDCAGKFPAL